MSMRAALYEAHGASAEVAHALAALDTAASLTRWSGDPVALADRRTDLADLRIRLALARGIAVEDIDPAGGRSLAWNDFRRDLDGWRETYSGTLPPPAVTAPQAYARALAWWFARRPRYFANDPELLTTMHLLGL